MLIAISPVMQLIFAPFWGNVSDRIGRKPVLMAGILGYGFSMLFFGLATQLGTPHSLSRRCGSRSQPHAHLL